MPILLSTSMLVYNNPMGRGKRVATGTIDAGAQFDHLLGPGRGSERSSDSPLDGLSRQRAEQEKERLLVMLTSDHPEEALDALLSGGEEHNSPLLKELQQKLISHCATRTVERWEGGIALATKIVHLEKLNTEGKASLRNHLEDMLAAQIFDTSPRSQADLDRLGDDEMPLALPMALAVNIAWVGQKAVDGLFRGANLESVLGKTYPSERNTARINQLMELRDWVEALGHITWDIPRDGQMEGSERENITTTCRQHVIERFLHARQRLKLRNLDISTPQER